MKDSSGRLIRTILAHTADGLIAFIPMLLVTFSGWLLIAIAQSLGPNNLAGSLAGLLAVLCFLFGMIWCTISLLFRNRIGRGRSLGKRLFGVERERYEE